ncbi:MAG: restriction endonuclease subunit R, partial [bacterium]
NRWNITVTESDLSEASFGAVKDSSSPVNMLIGSKKFVEGWDCWRVSTLGLMHVGKSEGAQIIQLFGRGVRLKGYDWTLKRSGHSNAPVVPQFIEELETLNVFGIEADFMDKFRKFLVDEGLPGNERRRIFTVPLNVTYEFGKKLKIIRPKKKKADGREYSFRKDGAIPTVGQLTDYLRLHPLVSDWYPRIQSIQSKQTGQNIKKEENILEEKHVALLDFDALYFELEQFKRERSWYNLNIDKDGIKKLFEESGWYKLCIPESHLNPQTYSGVILLQNVALELLKRYCEKYYKYCERSFFEPRLEVRELTEEDDNIPKENEYKLIVDGDEAQLIHSIETLKKELAEKKKSLPPINDINACLFGLHLFQPLFHVKKGGKVTITPVVLNESEFQFVLDLKEWYDSKKEELESEGVEMFLLRNMSRGKGVGFFEVGGFHPDFIMWTIKDGKQYVNFIEPHGMLREGLGSEKVQFYKKIKAVEKRIDDNMIVLNSFVLSCTQYHRLQTKETKKELEQNNILFMEDGGQNYLSKLFDKIFESIY